MLVGSAALYFGSEWELHNYLEDGQIGYVLFIVLNLEKFNPPFVMFE